MRFNLFYLVVVLLGIGLVFMFRPPSEGELSFFGFAESNETAINYNYPIVVDRILVQPGQRVTAGEPLLEVSRRKSKETLADQQYQIAELRAEERLWQQRRQNERSQQQQRLADRLAVIDAKIEALKAKIAYKRSLAEGLQSISADEASYQPLTAELTELRAERQREVAAAELAANNLDQEIRLGNQPIQERIRRLEAETEFEAGQKVQPFTVTAPADGLVGNVTVKEEEHVPSYETLLTFYEPHSSLVRGYVHEDQTAKVSVGDTLEVYSLKPAGKRYLARVIGLGSRIVETPARLRKLPDFKTYGREVSLQITPDNTFLQKEKVGVRRLENGEGL